jgi:hypothetical protein
MGLKYVHLYATPDGETHFADRELPTRPAPDGSVAHLAVPTTSMGYVEYPAGPVEIWPGFHGAPARQFITPLQGGFRTKVTDGDERVIDTGGWIFFDDLDSRGHVTVGLDGAARINLILGVPADWSPPEEDGRGPRA